MSQWSAIIYGRTWAVDYRFLAIPKDFEDTDQQWARKYIMATMHKRDKLKNCPRWSMFKNEKYCVIGLTYRIEDLINEDSLSDFDIRYDEQKRPNFVFVGYVANLSETLDSLPILLEQTSYFSSLTLDIYQRIFDKRTPKLIVMPYNENYIVNTLQSLPQTECKNININESFNIFKTDRYPIFLEHKEANIRQIWTYFSQYILISQYYRLRDDISLCIGADDQFDNNISIFTMVTVRDKIKPVNIIGYTSNVPNKPKELLNKYENKPEIKYPLSKLFNNRKNILIFFVGILIIQLPVILFINQVILPFFALKFISNVWLTSCILCAIGVVIWLTEIRK